MIIATKPRAWFLAAGILALFWNLIGVAFYLGHVGVLGGAFAEGNPPGAVLPDWVTGAYAVGVFGGALGSLGLVLRRSWARPVLWISLIALALDWGWVMLASGAGVTPLGIVVLVVAALLVWMASVGVGRGWLS